MPSDSATFDRGRSPDKNSSTASRRNSSGYFDGRPIRATPSSAQDRAENGVHHRGETSFLDYVRQKLPFRVEVIQTDNRSLFDSQFTGTCSTAASHVYIKPAKPRLNGKVEGSHRIDRAHGRGRDRCRYPGRRR